MKNVKVEIKLHELNELSESAKTKAISEHYNFMFETERPENFEDEEDYESHMNWLEKWSDGVENYVIENIEANEYLYFEDGSLANITHYCGKHEKAGKTEFKFMGKIYDITEASK